MDWTDVNLSWSPTDGVDNTHINSWEENFQVLHAGNGGDVPGIALGSSETYAIDLDDEHHVFAVTSAPAPPDIKFIQVFDRLPGNQITLINKTGSSMGIIIGASSPPVGYAIIGGPSANYLLFNNGTADFVYYDAVWYYKSLQ